MQLVERTFPGVSLLVNMNLDRLYTVGTVIAGLLAGAFLGSALVGY